MANAKILVIDDEKLIRWSLCKNLDKAGYQADSAATGEEGLVKFDEMTPEVVVLDHKLPGGNGLEIMTELKKRDPKLIILFMTAFGTIETAVEAMKRGAYDYINKPFVFDEVLQLLEKALHMRSLDNEVTQLKSTVRKQYDTGNIIAESQQMQDILNLVDKIARSKAPTVLITGESGVGKDLIARMIHEQGSRKKRPFVTINCASLPETLLESELFGHEKGAFTDAKNMKRGQFELAAEGTVYLDEIGEIPHGTQVKLLQVIENRTFKRVGGVKDNRIDSLIIAATNIYLAGAVEAGMFRRDLFYRLNLIPIEIPPLRERREDIIPISLYFVRRFNEEFKRQFKGIDPLARQVLAKYDWPGNVRELRNVIERIIILENDETIRVEHLPFEVRQRADEYQVELPEVSSSSMGIEIPSQGLSMESVERELVEKALKKTNNNQTRAAKLLDITRDSLRYKMKKFGLL